MATYAPSGWAVGICPSQLGPCCPDVSLVLPGWPRALGCQAGAALHAQPHVHVRVISHKPPVSTPIPPSSWTDLLGPHSSPGAACTRAGHNVGMEPSPSISRQEGERERSVPGPAGDRHGAEPPGQGGRSHAPRAAREPLQAPPAGEQPWATACADPEGSSTRRRSRDGRCSVGPAAHPVSLCLSLGQYKASYSRHFISPDKQERQDKEIFRQNMKRRLETFKSTKHNVCSSKSKARLKEKGRKKASSPQAPVLFVALRFGHTRMQ